MLDTSFARFIASMATFNDERASSRRFCRRESASMVGSRGGREKRWCRKAVRKGQNHGRSFCHGAPRAKAQHSRSLIVVEAFQGVACDRLGPSTQARGCIGPPRATLNLSTSGTPPLHRARKLDAPLADVMPNLPKVERSGVHVERRECTVPPPQPLGSIRSQNLRCHGKSNDGPQ